MRRQYHFRPSPRGLLAWDVHRLIALARGLPVHDVPLAAIRELGEPYWFSDGTVPTCRAVAEHMRLVESVDLRYPIILAADGRVMDGMHRVVRAYLAGHATIRAVRFTSDPAPDHVGMAPEALSYDDPPPPPE